MEKFILTAETLNEAREFMVTLGVDKYRADQIYDWIYRKNVFEFNKMSNLPKDLIALLNEKTETVTIETVEKKVSKKEGTKKYLLELKDGHTVESVYLPFRERSAVCLSVSVGCPLGCAFCATGKYGFVRHLTVDEITGQFLLINRDVVNEKGKGISNIVIMGMGEPFLNYTNLIKALEILAEPWGAGISPHRITVSTSGILTGIEKFSKESKPYNLSISLHSPFDEKRKQLIPLNKKYSLRLLMEAVDNYIEKKGDTVTFQYLLIGGYNDTKTDAVELTRFLRGPKYKVNIIVYNKVADVPFAKPSEQSIDRFVFMLSSSGIKVTRRKSMGEDIESGCGQLRLRYLKKN